MTADNPVSTHWPPSSMDTLCAAVLKRLRLQNATLSGELLSQELSVSRNSVWKCIEQLRTMGYHIEGTTRQGYRLSYAPDTPFPWEIADQLPTQELGQYGLYVVETTSTNDLARQLARQQAPHGLVVVTDKQLSGRGRRGRAWDSTDSIGLWFSLVLRPKLPPARLTLFPLLAGVAVIAAITEQTGLKAALKWPNDVLLNDKKVCGILLELSAEADRVHHLVLGIGINVNHDAQDFSAPLQSIATSLHVASGQVQPRVPLLRQVLAELERRYYQLVVEGPAALLNEVRAYSNMINKPVIVYGANGVEMTGTALDIAEDGALLVCDATGRVHTVYAGDVSVRSIVN
jgi:BirA family biotin operon repressor/biotin-[acetyl-CoA-carboxylase] ligase